MIQKSIFAIILLASLALSPFVLSSVATAAPPDPCSGSDTYVCKSTAQDLTGGILKNVINTMLFLAGTIAVIMVIIGGIRYITSDGDSSKATQAKNTIIYALVGITVAIMSYAIVNFIIGRL